MAFSTKIATCCYCGTRAALVLGQDRHELVCGSCGAPLHDLKRLLCEHPGKPEPGRSSVRRDIKREKKAKLHKKRAPARKHKKQRKGLMQHLFEEAFDVIEDIFD